jgi:hypothetical protein
MRTRHLLSVAAIIGGLVALSGCGGGDAEFCSMLDEVKAALDANDPSLRGERASPGDAPATTFIATKVLPGAAKCELLEAGSGLVLYMCQYPGAAVEAVRDRVNACGGDPLAWDESGKQWFRGAGDNLTLSVTTNEETGLETAGTSIYYTRY